MKKIILEIEFDDTDGYKGHGENTAELIKAALENEMSVSFEADKVIKNGWKVTLKNEGNTPQTEIKPKMKKTQFLLKKDIPTIKSGRIINLSEDGKFGSPILMEVEKKDCILYMFPIEIMKNNKDWFEELVHDTSEEIISEPFVEQEQFQRGDKVSFNGNDKFKAIEGTYIWAVNHHLIEMYYIQHPDGNVTKESMEYNGGFEDGFESPHSKYFNKGVKYICVMPEEIKKCN